MISSLKEKIYLFIAELIIGDDKTKCGTNRVGRGGSIPSARCKSD